MATPGLRGEFPQPGTLVLSSRCVLGERDLVTTRESVHGGARSLSSTAGKRRDPGGQEAGDWCGQFTGIFPPYSYVSNFASVTVLGMFA